jgi:hypothetical protein
MSKSLLSQQDQLENLKLQYGLSLNFVEVTIPLTENEMIDIWGENCEEYEHGCSLCRAWHQWQSNNHKVTVVVSRDSIVKAAKND